MAPLGSCSEGVSPSPSMEFGRGLYMSVTCAKAQRHQVSRPSMNAWLAVSPGSTHNYSTYQT